MTHSGRANGLADRMRILLASVLLLLGVSLTGCGDSGHLPARVIATIQVGLPPRAVDVNPTTNRIYVLQGDRPGMTLPGTVSVIDGATNTVTATVPVGVSACQLAVDPVTDRIYVTNEGEQFVTVIDGATNNTTTINVGYNACELAINTKTNKIYVPTENNTVTVIDGATSETTKIAFDAPTSNIVVNSATNTAYVVLDAHGPARIAAIDGATNNTAEIASLNSPVLSTAVNSGTNQVYAVYDFPDLHYSGLAIVDGTTFAISRVGDDPIFRDPPTGGIAVNESTNRIYVTRNSGAVSVIDGPTLSTLNVMTSPVPDFVTVDSGINQIYSLNTNSDSSAHGTTCTVIDGATNLTTTLQVGVAPIAAAVNPVTHRVYVANSCGNDPNCLLAPGTVSVIEAAH